MNKNFALIPGASLVIFLLAVVVGYGAPMLDSEVRKFGPRTAGRTAAALDGKRVYDDQGCAFCHTQNVRPVSNDLGLGKVTDSQRVVRDDRSELGLARIGPDLSCFGDRERDALKISAFLSDPSSARTLSRMPSYRHLDQEEMDELTAYLSSLVCGGGQ